MRYSYIIFAANVPSAVFALIGNDWSFSKAPSAGLDDVTFPFNMANAPHTTGFYFAEQFRFVNVAEVGYTGIQPRPNTGGKNIVHGVFSSFQGGTTTSHSNCYLGADGGPGVSCAVDVAGDYSHTYDLVVENIGGTTWRGTLVDTVTQVSVVIGEWTLPSGAGKLRNGQQGFVEYFPWNSRPSHNCNSLPKTEAVFGKPTSQTSGASGGDITNVYEYGSCVGKVAASAKKTSLGYDITVGF